jgi:AraC-like DNA-binding protein
MQRKMSSHPAEVKGPKRTAGLLLANPFDRFDLGEGVTGWVYTFTNSSVIPIPPHTSGALEIAVQLDGRWELGVWGQPSKSFERGAVFTVPRGVRHTYGFCADGTPGHQVGFAIHLADHPRFNRSPLVWKHAVVGGTSAKSFRELAVRVCSWRRAASPSSEVANQVRSELWRLVETELDCSADAPVVRAMTELERHLDRPLYLKHLAEAAGIHEKALSRRFLEQAGVSPIRLRTELRLSRAIRLLWSRADLSVAEAARAVGFDSPRFFHRLAVQTFGLTPAQLARRPYRAG